MYVMLLEKISFFIKCVEWNYKDKEDFHTT